MAKRKKKIFRNCPRDEGEVPNYNKWNRIPDGDRHFFHYWAFRKAYSSLFAEEDLLTRFVRAIVITRDEAFTDEQRKLGIKAMKAGLKLVEKIPYHLRSKRSERGEFMGDDEIEQQNKLRVLTNKIARQARKIMKGGQYEEKA